MIEPLQDQIYKLNMKLYLTLTLLLLLLTFTPPTQCARKRARSSSSRPSPSRSRPSPSDGGGRIRSSSDVGGGSIRSSRHRARGGSIDVDGDGEIDYSDSMRLTSWNRMNTNLNPFSMFGPKQKNKKKFRNIPGSSEKYSTFSRFMYGMANFQYLSISAVIAIILFFLFKMFKLGYRQYIKSQLCSLPLGNYKDRKYYEQKLS